MQIFFARFSTQGDKLATYEYDSTNGQAKLWFNDSNVYAPKYTITFQQKVRDMQWSPCGSYIAVCGDKIEILSGHDLQRLHVSSADQYFDEYAMSCAWNDCSTQLAIGSSHGRVLVIDPNYDINHALMFLKDSSINNLQYFGTVQEIQVTSRQGQNIFVESQALSAYFSTGDVIFDLRVRLCYCTTRVQTDLIKGMAKWNADKTMLAVVGYYSNSPQILSAKFFNQFGDIMTSVDRVLQLPRVPTVS